MSRPKALIIASIGTVFMMTPIVALYYYKYNKTAMLINVTLLSFISIYGIASGFITRWKSDIPFAIFGIASLIFAYAAFYQINGGLIENGVTVEGKAKAVTDLLNCLYFSVVTWTTLGYGDITPSGSARAIAASEAILGYLLSALLIALLVDRLGRR